MSEITYINGDATLPVGEGNKILIHCCNDKSGWGKGFVLALSKRWKKPESEYRNWRHKGGFKLGNVQYVKVEDDLVVCNMIAQHGIGRKKGVPPIRYGAMEKCLKKVGESAKKNNATVHLPYLMGCALAGGDWKIVSKQIEDNICALGVDVFAYKFGG